MQYKNGNKTSRNQFGLGNAFACYSHPGTKLIIFDKTGNELSRTDSWLTHIDTHPRTHRRRQEQYPKAKTGLG